MGPERWERVKDVFDAALDLEASRRPGFLEETCAADEELRGTVEQLLREYERAGTAFLRTGPSAPQTENAERCWVGEVLNGRYRIERELGRGGSGVVYLAADQLLHERPVVVKLLHERAERHPVARARFRHEMEALARIRHPGVVAVLDVGELPGDREFLVMEYLEGATLRSQIDGGGLPLDRAARLIEQVSAALASAHEQGITHQDLKPENIMLLGAGEPDETAKLIDFGIAKVEQAHTRNQTDTWTFAGTVNYVSPEQLLGRSGPAGDIWALGVVAYEMVTGQRPFDPETPFHLYELQRSQRFPDPVRFRPDLPASMSAAILKALSFEPAARQASAEAFAREFCGKGKVPRRTVWRRWRWRGVAAAAMALAALAWRWGMGNETTGAPPALRARDLIINTPLGVAADARGNVYFSEYANHRVWRVEPDGSARPIAGSGVAGTAGNGGSAVRAQIISPRNVTLDGAKYLYFVETTADRVRRVDLNSGVIAHVLGTGQPRFNGDGQAGILTSFSEGLGLAVTPSGDLLFCDTNNHRIRRLSAADGKVVTIAGTGVSGSTGDGGPAAAAQVARPSGLALHPNGDVYFFEFGSRRIRRIHDGRIATIAGNPESPNLEGPAMQVNVGSSTGISLDPGGSYLYFTDEASDTLRKLDLANNTIAIVAGNGSDGYSGDNGPAIRAQMANPTGVAVDRQGNIYVAEAMSNRIRRIDSRGIISTFAGGRATYEPSSAASSTRELLAKWGELLKLPRLRNSEP